ncbi:hypothetical protein K461DRAFT_176052 [Myriangium duriaei CBS 260.36]|uniref:Uncharacterized protein n=1 Tax=Myriangium duriaei CBS 260.36 TaxID=1168546 RepID=A0A9P4J0Z7_9PEZI|nr:hypothetical protein K461DRAFT_176052 [Myriangium duriaei CBS 260.36]
MSSRTPSKTSTIPFSRGSITTPFKSLVTSPRTSTTARTSTTSKTTSTTRKSSTTTTKSTSLRPQSTPSTSPFQSSTKTSRSTTKSTTTTRGSTKTSSVSMTTRHTSSTTKASLTTTESVAVATRKTSSTTPTTMTGLTTTAVAILTPTTTSTKTTTAVVSTTASSPSSDTLTTTSSSSLDMLTPAMTSMSAISTTTSIPTSSSLFLCGTSSVTTFSISTCTSRSNAVISPSKTITFSTGTLNALTATVALAPLDTSTSYGITFDAGRFLGGAGGAALCNVTAAINGQNLTSVTTNYYFYYVAQRTSTINRAPGVSYQPTSSNSSMLLYMTCPMGLESNYWATNFAVTPICDAGEVIKTTPGPFDCVNVVGNGAFAAIDYSSPDPFIGWLSHETPLDTADPTFSGGYTGQNTTDTGAVLFTGTTSSLSQSLTNLDTSLQYNISFVAKLGVPANGSCDATAWLDDVPVLTTYPSANTTAWVWEPYSAVFQPNTSTPTLTIGINCTGRYFLYDWFLSRFYPGVAIDDVSIVRL